MRIKKLKLVFTLTLLIGAVFLFNNIIKEIAFAFTTCGDTVTFTYKGSSVTYGTVSSSGKCWLDRNLGASQVATSYNNADAYGDLFQWGRLDDGHQTRTSGITTTLSSSDNPGHSNFIYGMGSPSDWRSPQNNNLWQGVSGTNNPCPLGWRLPTYAEWDTERASWGQQNYNGAFTSPLKLTAAGLRFDDNASLGYVGSAGYYWSGTVIGGYAHNLYLGGSSADMAAFNRALGFTVRCILANTVTFPTVMTNTAIGDTETLRVYFYGNLANLGGDTTCEVWFDYGPYNPSNPSSYGYSTSKMNLTAPTDPFSSFIAIPVNEVYHFRAVAKNAAGTAYGGDKQVVIYESPSGEREVVTPGDDLNPPTVTISGAPASWQNTDAQATVLCLDSGSGCDNTTFKIKTHTSNPTTCSINYADYTVSSPAAISSHYWICGVAKDLRGNVGVSTPVEFKIDKIKPATGITNPPDDSWQKDDFTVTLDDSDDGDSGLVSGTAGCEYFINDINYATHTTGIIKRQCDPVSRVVLVGTLTSDICAEDRVGTFGESTCRVNSRSFDNAGNNSGWKSASYKIDYTYPAVGKPSCSAASGDCIIGPSCTTALQGEEMKFCATLSDSLGKITGCSFYVDGTTIGTATVSPIPCENGENCKVSINYAFPSFGNHVVYFRCHDAAGNYADGESTTVTLTTNHPPEIISGPSYTTSPCSEPTIQPDCNVNFSVSATDADGDPLYYTWIFSDGGSSIQQNPSHHYYIAGTYPVTVTVSDGRGGITAKGINIQVTEGSLAVDLCAGLESTISISCSKHLSTRSPVNNLKLKALVTGSMTGSIHYQFDCENDGTYDYDYTTQNPPGSNENPLTTPGICNYVKSTGGNLTVIDSFNNETMIASKTNLTITVDGKLKLTVDASACVGDCSEIKADDTCGPKPAGENGLAACKRCDGSSLTSVNVSAFVDSEGLNTCSGACASYCSSGSCIGADTGAGTCTVATNARVSSGGDGYCSSAICLVNKKSNGAVCSLGSECFSTYCADGVCCNSACTGDFCKICDSRSNAGAGTCGYVNSASVDPDGNCEPTGCNTGNCSGTGYTCGYYTSGQRGCSTCQACNASGVCTAQTVDGVAATALGCTAGNEACRRCNNGTCTFYTTDQHGCAADYVCNASGNCVIITQTCYSGSTPQTTNWGTNLYGCSGANTRCYGGVCRTCDSDGYLYSDSCSGCAGQGGLGCWRRERPATTYVSCLSICSNFGGCVDARWNDTGGCTVCKYFHPSFACNTASNAFVCSYDPNSFFRIIPYTVGTNCMTQIGGYMCNVCDASVNNYTRLCVCQY